MNSSFPVAVRLGVALSIVALQSCSAGSSPLMPASAPSAQFAASHRAVRAAKGSGERIYVASYSNSAVLVYGPNLNSPPLRAITTGVAGPLAIALDGHGTLYVANSGATSSGASSNTVTVYARGASKPSLTYSGFTYPEGVAVASDGTLYVADATGSSGSGVVRVYRNGSTAPTSSITYHNAFAMGVTVDSHDNLYVSWWAQVTRQTKVVEYAGGSGSGVNLGLHLPSHAVPSHTIAFDHAGNLVLPVETNLYGALRPEYLAVFAPGATKPRKLFLGSLANLVYGVAFPPNDPNTVYITGQNSNNFLRLTYPGRQVRDATPVGNATGIVIAGN